VTLRRVRCFRRRVGANRNEARFLNGRPREPPVGSLSNKLDGLQVGVRGILFGVAIVIRNQGGKWEKAERVIFADEAQLQKLLYGSPELIPTRLEGQVSVFTREAGLPGSGFTDLLGVDGQGNVMIIETKLARNGEIRRKVIGQVLEYAAYLWGMAFEDFDGFFLKREGKSLLELLAEKSPTIDQSQLKQDIERNLASGKFQLVIAVDGMNPELEKVIAYVSSRGTGLQLEALELELHRQGEVEILVPQRYGQLNQPQEPQSAKRTLTFEEILQNCPDEHSRNLLSVLGDLWEGAGNSVRPGAVGASFQTHIGVKPQAIFWAGPYGLQNAFSEIVRREAPQDLLEIYRQAVANIQGFNREEVLSKQQPTTKFSQLSEDAVKAFVAESQTLVEAWRKSVGSVGS